MIADHRLTSSQNHPPPDQSITSKPYSTDRRQTQIYRLHVAPTPYGTTAKTTLPVPRLNRIKSEFTGITDLESTPSRPVGDCSSSQIQPCSHSVNPRAPRSTLVTSTELPSSAGRSKFTAFMSSSVDRIGSTLWSMATSTLMMMSPVFLIIVIVIVLYSICAQSFSSTVASWLQPLAHAFRVVVIRLANTIQSAVTVSYVSLCVIPAFHGLCPQSQHPLALYSEHVTPTLTALTDNHRTVLTTVHSLRSFTASLSSIYVVIPPAECEILDAFLHKSRRFQALLDGYATDSLLLTNDIDFRSSFLVDDLERSIESPTYGALALSLVGHEDHATSSRHNLLTTLESWSQAVDNLSYTAEVIAHHWTDYQVALGHFTSELQTRRQRQILGWWLNFSGFAVTLHQHAVLSGYMYLASSVDMIQREAPSILAIVDMNLGIAKANLGTAQTDIPQAKAHLLLAWERRSPIFGTLLKDFRAMVAKAQLSHKDRDLA